MAEFQLPRIGDGRPLNRGTGSGSRLEHPGDPRQPVQPQGRPGPRRPANFQDAQRQSPESPASIQSSGCTAPGGSVNFQVENGHGLNRAAHGLNRELYTSPLQDDGAGFTFCRNAGDMARSSLDCGDTGTQLRSDTITGGLVLSAGASEIESSEVQDAIETMNAMPLHMVYVGKGVQDPPRALEEGRAVDDVPPEVEAVVLLCYADFLDITCSVIKTLKQALCARPIIPVVLRPAHGVLLAKLSIIAMTLKKGGADNVIIQPREKLDLQEKIEVALGFVGVRWEYERHLRAQPDLRANTLFFEVVDQVIEGFPKLNPSLEEKRPTRNSLGGVGRHVFSKALGEGKFGKVYTTASDRQDGPCEAVKVISKRNIKTAKHCSQVLKECRLLQKVRHPNIAEFRGLVHAMWHVYIFMEFVGAMDLSVVIRSAENGRLESAHVLEFFLQICDAVAYCHQMLVAHRDIKSENIVVTADAVPKLVDFGLAVQLTTSSSPQLCCDKCGTIPFAPPEVYRGKNYEASAMDVWGLGILTLEMRCGNNSVCRMLGCKIAVEPNDQLAEMVERFFSDPDWPLIAQQANPGVGMAEELLVVMRNSLVVAPELRWRAADLWKHMANSSRVDRETLKSDRVTTGSNALDHAEYCMDEGDYEDDEELLHITTERCSNSASARSARHRNASDAANNPRHDAQFRQRRMSPEADHPEPRMARLADSLQS